MQQMQITTAKCASGDLQDDISGLQNLRPRGLDNLDLVLALPYQGLHLVGLVAGGIVVSDILLSDGAAIVANGLLGVVCCFSHRHFGMDDYSRSIKVDMVGRVSKEVLIKINSEWGEALF